MQLIYHVLIPILIIGVVWYYRKDKCSPHMFNLIDTLPKNVHGIKSMVYVSRCEICGKISKKEVK